MHCHSNFDAAHLNIITQRTFESNILNFTHSSCKRLAFKANLASVWFWCSKLQLNTNTYQTSQSTACSSGTGMPWAGTFQDRKMGLPVQHTVLYTTKMRKLIALSEWPFTSSWLQSLRGVLKSAQTAQLNTGSHWNSTNVLYCTCKWKGGSKLQNLCSEKQGYKYCLLISYCWACLCLFVSHCL